MTEPTKHEDEHTGGPRHAAPDGASRHPLIDMTRDPTPGVPDHAAKNDGEDEDRSA